MDTLNNKNFPSIKNTSSKQKLLVFIVFSIDGTFYYS